MIVDFKTINGFLQYQHRLFGDVSCIVAWSWQAEGPWKTSFAFTVEDHLVHLMKAYNDETQKWILIEVELHQFILSADPIWYRSYVLKTRLYVGLSGCWGWKQGTNIYLHTLCDTKWCILDESMTMKPNLVWAPESVFLIVWQGLKTLYDWWIRGIFLYSFNRWLAFEKCLCSVLAAKWLS